MKFHLLCGYFIIILLGLAAPDVSADEFTDRRIQASVRLFRTLLASDIDIEQKKISRVS